MCELFNDEGETQESNEISFIYHTYIVKYSI